MEFVHDEWPCLSISFVPYGFQSSRGPIPTEIFQTFFKYFKRRFWTFISIFRQTSIQISVRFRNKRCVGFVWFAFKGKGSQKPVSIRVFLAAKIGQLHFS